MMGLKLGKAFRDLGAKAGREAIRALPMAVADLVQEVFDEEAVRGPLSTRGVLYTSMGPWATGTAAVFLNDSAGTDGGASGTAVFARGGTGALAAALESAARARGVEVRTGAEVAAIRSKDGVVRGVTLADGTELDTTLVVSAADPKRTLRLCDPVELNPYEVWRAGEHPPTWCDRQGQPGALRAAVVQRRRRRRAIAGAHRRRHVDRSRRAGDGRLQVRARRRGSRARGHDPDPRRPVAGPRGHARHVDRVPGGAAYRCATGAGPASETGSPTSP